MTAHCQLIINMIKNFLKKLKSQLAHRYKNEHILCSPSPEKDMLNPYCEIISLYI